jgi:hypothetical protein
MKVAGRLLRGVLAVAIAASVVAPAGATTLIRQGLDGLVADNSTIVVGEVLDVASYWNENGDFILTDVRVAVVEVLKGRVQDPELTVTLMGGTVGDLTTLILGTAELIPGRPYVLFLNEEDIPGARALTVRDHCQGAFDLVMTKGGLRAISQANQHPLVPDHLGYFEAPGGVQGLPFKDMVESIRDLADRQQRGSRQEVK